MDKIARLVLAGNHSTTFCNCDKCTTINNVRPIGQKIDHDKEGFALRAANAFRSNFVRLRVSNKVNCFVL